MMSETMDFAGWYDIVYSPDDGGYYADLLWDRDVDSPIYSSPAKAEAWAKKKGGTRRLQGGY
jgi:hypothetical protein